jgi:uncharacterized membrane protein
MNFREYLEYCSIEQHNEQEVQKEREKFLFRLNVEQLNILIDKTLKETTKTTKLYKWVNVAIIALGVILILGAAICSVIWQANTQTSIRYGIFLAFGGFGLTVIIASLIANPINSINKTTRQQIQIRIAYFSFLKQIEILNRVRRENDTVADTIKQSERLEKATISLQETLSKYFDEHKKTSVKIIDD